MADWSVSDSETDEATYEKHNGLEPSRIVSLTLAKVFGKVDSKRVVDLMQRISIHKSLQLDCTNGYLEERMRKKRKRKRKHRDSFPDGEVSETTSERISTHTASTSGGATECRDQRRPSLSAFDYEHEGGEFPALIGANALIPGKKKKPRLSKKLNPKPPPAALATIEAKLRNEELQANNMSIDDGDIMDNGRGEREDISHPHDPHVPSTNLTSNRTNQQCIAVSMSRNGLSGIPSSATNTRTFNFSFDDDDENELSFNSQDDDSIFSKIRRIENFLDQN